MSRFKTALIGFGRIAQGYAADPIMARHFRYATHAQVLSNHPEFDWVAVVDPSGSACMDALNNWKIKQVAPEPVKLANAHEVEVAIIATPPENRIKVLDAFPNLRAVIVEKPLAMELEEAIRFADACRRRKIVTQVNLMRRADIFTRTLTAGGLDRMIGAPQAVFGVYGNGLANNGAHMIDLVRMILGEVESAQAIVGTKAFQSGPITGDTNIAFNLVLESKLAVTMQPVRFSHYRENSLEIWGEKGRLSYMHGGATVLFCPCKENRLISDEYEIVVDKPEVLTSTIGTAIYEIYANLANALRKGEELLSPIESALKTSAIIEAIHRSANSSGGKVIYPAELITHSRATVVS